MKGFTFVGFVTKGSREQMTHALRLRFPLNMAISNEKPYPTAAEAMKEAKKRRLRDITIHESEPAPPGPPTRTFTSSGQ